MMMVMLMLMVVVVVMVKILMACRQPQQCRHFSTLCFCFLLLFRSKLKWSDWILFLLMHM